MKRCAICKEKTKDPWKCTIVKWQNVKEVSFELCSKCAVDLTKYIIQQTQENEKENIKE